MIFKKTKKYDNNINEDFKILNDTVNNKIDILVNITLKLVSMHQNEAINEKYCQEASARIIIETINELSPKYVKYIYRKYYRNYETFIKLISEKIYIHLFMSILAANQDYLNKKIKMSPDQNN